MREILFKGKRVDNGEWVYGSLVMVTDGESLKKYPCIVISYNHDTFDWHKVQEETVGQYTGLKDKKGVKIFEGDRISVFGGAKYIVKFIQFEWGALNGNVYYGFCQLKTDITEVIGNIHDD